MMPGRDDGATPGDGREVAGAAPALPTRLVNAPWLLRCDTQIVLGMINSGGEEARIVGGAVRNALMGEPVSDVDIATTAAPARVMALARKAGLRAVDTGAGHGTVTVIAHGTPFEITTLRTDEETFGRHARVAFTRDWQADARRRDFTMNALYAAADGTLFDPLGGYADLMARRVRFIGDPFQRIREDYLRILRFFRFSAEYGAHTSSAVALDEAGLRACESESGGLAQLSAERIRVELLRLMAAPSALPTLEAMRDAGILVRMLGGVVWLGALRRLGAIEQNLSLAPQPLVRLGVLSVRVSEHAAALRRKLRLGNDEHELLQAMSAHASTLRLMDESGICSLFYRLRRERLLPVLLHAWAVAGAAPDDPRWRDVWERAASWDQPEFPLSGADLLALGLKPGPDLGESLRYLEAEWIKSGFELDREGLLSRARELVARAGRGDKPAGH